VNAAAAAATTGRSNRKVGVLTTTAEEVNINWNSAGDVEAAEPATEARDHVDVVSAHAEVDNAFSILVSESASEMSSSRVSETVERDVKQSRSSTEAVETSTTQLQLCVRRTIAEDETWDLKTVPDLDMLVVKHIADHYAGTTFILHWIGLSSVLRLRQHSIGYMGDGFYRSKDPTNSIKVLKEQIVHRQIKHTISRHKHKTQQVL